MHRVGVGRTLKRVFFFGVPFERFLEESGSDAHGGRPRLQIDSRAAAEQQLARGPRDESLELALESRVPGPSRLDELCASLDERGRYIAFLPPKRRLPRIRDPLVEVLRKLVYHFFLGFGRRDLHATVFFLGRCFRRLGDGPLGATRVCRRGGVGHATTTATGLGRLRCGSRRGRKIAHFERPMRVNVCGRVLFCPLARKVGNRAKEKVGSLGPNAARFARLRCCTRDLNSRRPVICFVLRSELIAELAQLGCLRLHPTLGTPRHRKNARTELLEPLG